jgi:hypothetical protein
MTVCQRGFNDLGEVYGTGKLAMLFFVILEVCAFSEGS